MVVGVLAGAGSTNLLADAPVQTERTVQVPGQSADVPEEHDPLVQWLKEHPRR